MKTNKPVTICFFFLFCLLRPETGIGQNPCDNIRELFKDEPKVMFENLLSRECLGGKEDNSSFMLEIREAVSQMAESIPDEVPDQIVTLRELSTVFSITKKQILSIYTTSIDEQFVIEKMIAAIDTSKSTVNSLLEPDNMILLEIHRRTVAPMLANYEWKPNDWGRRSLYIELNPNYGYQPIQVNQSLLAPNCEPYKENINTETCNNAIEITEIVLRSAYAISHYASENAKDFINSLFEHAKVLENQWDYYLNDARTQTILELKLNSRVWRSRTKDHPAGFRSPPSGQIILLHPSAGLDILINNDGNEIVKPALFLEVIGYNRWSYKTDGSTGLAKGASLLVSYTGRTTTSDWGYGAMFHLQNRYSLGVVMYGSELGIMASAQLWSRGGERVLSYFR